MEEGHWVEVGNMRAWVSSMHLVHEKEAQLKRMQEHWEEHRRMQCATSDASVTRKSPLEPVCDV